MKKKIQLITLGCPKNEVDSEVIGKIAKNAGYEIESDEVNADVIVINTCGFIDDAKKESLEQIEDALKKKQNGEVTKVYVAGCMVQRYEKRLRERFDTVDNFFGVTDYTAISNEFNVPCWGLDKFPRQRLNLAHYAYLKISEGCDYRCSFCAIPSIRGNQVSRKLNDLIDEAKTLIQSGAKELIVIAEDSTQYGKDLAANDNLSTLLASLNQLDGLEWIKLMYAYPGSITDELVDVLKNSEKICAYLDMPIQHINNRVLKRMKRNYRRSHVEETVAKLRTSISGISLRTSVITGFPGETDDEFIELSDFLYDVKFDRLGVFQYSDEEGTSAYDLDSKIEKQVITERYEEIRQNHDEVSEEINTGFMGKKLKVLIDNTDSGKSIGRTERDAPDVDNVVIINRSIEPGSFVEVTINETLPHELIGQ